MMKFSHENLEIWQLGMKLVDLTYSLKDRFLSEDKFGLWDQLVRSVEAVPRDIAEGYGKSSKKERALYMERAKSEVAEADTSFKEAVKKRRIQQEEYENLAKPLIKELYFKIIGYRKWLLKDSTKASADSPSQPRRQPILHLNQAKRSTTGFTLIEVLMIVFILGIVVVMGGNLFFSILKGASKSEVVKEAKQNGDYAMSIMERTIKNAKQITECTSSSITLQNPDGTTTAFNCVFEDSVAKINSSTGRLTGKNVTLGAGASSCSGTTLSFNCQTTTTPPTVAISFTLSQAGSSTRPEEKAQATFQTTVSLRNY